MTRYLLAGLLVSLAGCATGPAPVAAPPLVSYADMRFEPMPPTGPRDVELREDGPSYAFPEGAGGFAALALPARPQPTYVRFRSSTQNSMYVNLKVMIPRFIFLDAGKAPLESAVAFPILQGSDFWSGIFYAGQVRIPDRAVFVVVTATREVREPLVVTAPDSKQYTLPLVATGETRLEISTVPTALVSDSVVVVSQARAQMFVIKELDGKPIPNSFGDSAARSHGQGIKLTPVTTKREVPAKKLKARLLGSGTAAAPILSIIDSIAGDDPEVEGVVDFEPVEGRQYIVKGQLQERGSSIWIEDAETGQPVTEKIVGP